ncbi:hypothetical protein B4092_4850 [Bacillus licheniformis]|uniref:hypothetical protein n=1 Tax=Bacillus licheniformis TaxID=1402 RepID=UPI00079241C5|nr:hypothetical protein [Bacillus licheniformis]KYC77113.1 hypothetical protein B4092_4850 [Bacillus licheniformis]TWN76540.1 hypothetical protein CHCC20494_0603 [Bacillus licheniformis]
MNIEGFIELAEKEIKQLKEDMHYSRHDVSIRILLQAIEDRQKTIEEVKEKYLNR